MALDLKEKRHSYTLVPSIPISTHEDPHSSRAVPPYVPAAVFTVAVAILSDKVKMRGPFMLLFLPIAMAGMG